MLTSTTPFLEWIIALGGAGSVLAGWWFWGRKRLRARAQKKADEHAQTVRRVQMLEEMYIALRPNGGTSIADHVADIKKTTKGIDRSLSVTETGRRTLVAVMEIGEWHSDSTGQCTHINAAACRICNRPEEDFLGRNWYNVVYPEDVEWVADEWDRAVREKRVFRAKYRWSKSDGTPVPIRVVANPVLDSGGVLIGWVAIVRSESNP